MRVFGLQVNAVGKELGLGFAGMGYDPKWSVEQRPAVDKVSSSFIFIKSIMHLYKMIKSHNRSVIACEKSKCFENLLSLVQVYL